MHIYTLIWYMCIWYGVPCSYSNFECIFKSLRCSISTLVFDTSPPKSFAMDFPKNHRKCGVAYYSRRSACKCTWVRSSSCHFKHSSKGNNLKGSIVFGEDMHREPGICKTAAIQWCDPVALPHPNFRRGKSRKNLQTHMKLYTSYDFGARIPPKSTWSCKQKNGDGTSKKP